MKQLKLFATKKYPRRKTARSISLRATNHIVLKSSRPILRKHMGMIRALIRETQARYGVKLRSLAIMSTHVHLVMKVSSRIQFARTLRFLASRIALKVTGAKLWRQRAWSRPVGSKRDLCTVERYVARNPIKAGIWSTGDAFFVVDGVLQL